TERGHWQSRVGFSTPNRAIVGPAKASEFLPLGQSVPAHGSQRVVRHFLDAPCDQSRAAPVTSKSRSFPTVRIPDIERGAEDISSGVIDEVASEVLGAEKHIDVAGEREDPRIGRDDSVTRLAAASSL